VKFIFVCGCGKIEGKKIISSLSLDSVKVGAYDDFLHPYDGPRKMNMDLRKHLKCEKNCIYEQRRLGRILF
jgi:hypothetical protein